MIKKTTSLCRDVEIRLKVANLKKIISFLKQCFRSARPNNSKLSTKNL